MLAFRIDESAVRNFMNRLLREELFDAYEVRLIEVNALTHMEISGELDGNESRKFAVWSQLRPLVHTVIKSGPMPRLLKIVFSCGAELTASLHPNASALFLNMTYENGGVTFTTATAQKQFSLEKTLDACWDEYITAFFRQCGTAVTLLS